ncbi:ferredoxin [Streptomyces lactacystinicus]|uniref:ferredoxin n=1 Tax=Kitasatospora sp. NPDC006786 TaxID=3157187 RepID=UPI003385D68C
MVNGDHRPERPAARVEADTSRCVSSGQCAMTAPSVFDQDESGRVVVLAADPGGPAAEQAREAAAMCPASAIRLRPAR